MLINSAVVQLFTKLLLQPMGWVNCRNLGCRSEMLPFTLQGSFKIQISVVMIIFVCNGCIKSSVKHEGLHLGQFDFLGVIR
jgi:hypothetical protein